MRALVTSNIKLTNVESRSISQYLKEVSKIPLLTPDQEYEIAIKAQQGCESSREKLVKHNLRFVISVAKQYQRKNVPLTDLINEGNIGIIQSAKTFDPTRGFKFISFAVWNVRKMIISYIQTKQDTIRLPLNRINAISKLRKIHTTLEQKLERKPTVRDFLDNNNNGFSEDDISFYLLNHNTPSISIDMSYDDFDDVNTKEYITNKLNNDHSLSAENIINIVESSELANKLLSYITDFDERYILMNFYGFNCVRPQTISEISSDLGYTPNKVQTIKANALSKLKNKIKDVNL